MFRGRFEISRSWSILLCLPSPRGKENQSWCREYTVPRDQEGTRMKGWIQSNVRFGPVSDIKSLQSIRKIQCWSSSSIFISRSNRILEYNCERYWQICQRSRADPRGRESFGETRCKGETNILTTINKWLGFHFHWAKTMDWHWNTGIHGSLLSTCVRIHLSITSTQSTS